MSNLPIPLLLCISLTASTGMATLQTFFMKRKKAAAFDAYLYTLVVSLVCAILIAVLFGRGMTFSPLTVLLGALFGLASLSQQVLISLALRLGPLSSTNTICCMGAILSAFTGVLFFNEDLTPVMVIGIILMVFCFLFAVKKESDEQKKKASIKWLLAVSGGCLASTAVGCLQKVHQESAVSGELYSMLLVSFLVGIVGAVPFVLVGMKREKGEESMRELLKPLLPALPLALFAGVGSATCNVINLYLIGAMNSAVIFPLFNGTALILTILIGCLIFRERLTRRQWVGIGVGLVATVRLGFG